MIDLDVNLIKNTSERLDLIRALRYVRESSAGLETALTEQNQDDVNLYGEQLDRAIEEYDSCADRLQARAQRLKKIKENLKEHIE